MGEFTTNLPFLEEEKVKVSGICICSKRFKDEHIRNTQLK